MIQTQYTIDQLCEMTGFRRRTIRFYVQEGIIDPPAGRGRGGFYYDSHLETLLRIRTLQQQGLNLADIRRYLGEGEKAEPAYRREAWLRYDVADGVELAVRRDIDEADRRKVEQMLRVIKSILKGE